MTDYQYIHTVYGGQRFLRLVNSLSLDVTAGAMSCAVFFASLLNVNVSLASLVLLGLAVWIIYTVDHLLDANKIKTTATTHRHRLHQEHHKTLRVAALAAAIVGCILLAFNSEHLLPGGLLLTVVVALYALVQRYLSALKEVLISLAYTGGVLLPTWIASGGDVALPWIIVAQVALTALLNLLMFSYFDANNDLRHGFTSFALRWGRPFTHACCWVAFALCCLLTLFSATPMASLLICLVATIQLVPLVNQKYFEVNERYRLLGDGAFMLPAVWVLFE